MSHYIKSTNMTRKEHCYLPSMVFCFYEIISTAITLFFRSELKFSREIVEISLYTITILTVTI